MGQGVANEIANGGNNYITIPAIAMIRRLNPALRVRSRSTHDQQPSQPRISDQTPTPATKAARKGFGPRVRRLHARIGARPPPGEGMTFSPPPCLTGRPNPLQFGGPDSAPGPRLRP